MLKNVGEDLWVAEHHFASGGVDFGGRMTVVRLADGELLLYSVIAIDDALAAELEALGPVAHIVAPNSFHHLFVGAACERWPDAKVYGTAALRKKMPKLRLDVMLTNEAPAAWGESVEMLFVEGAPKIDEVILHHRTSGTLILCDLVFHIHEARGWFSPLFFRMIGVWGRVKQSPLWRFVFTNDRAAAERSLEPMWGWDFERVVLAHGRIIEGSDAKAQLAEGMTWMCRGHARPRLPAPA